MYALYFDGTKISLKNDYLVPKSSEALIKVRLAGICGTDLEMIRGYMSYAGILGHEFVGVVEKSDNPDLVGKRVVGEINIGCGNCNYCEIGLERHCQNRSVLGIYKRDGAFAEYLVLPEKNLHTIPDSISDRQAVFVEPLAAAFEIDEQLHINSNQKIAIIGDGRLAQLIARVLKLKNPNITCFGRHQNKLQLLHKFRIKTKTQIASDDELQFDVVVEATGREGGFSDAMRLVKPRGKVVLKSTIVSKNKLDFAPAIINEITIVGSRCGPFRPAINALALGLVLVDDLISATYPISEYQKAFSEAAKSENLKILLAP
jgi:threonine dehydrogenase-like Zn-dependent dehydrogenase